MSMRSYHRIDIALDTYPYHGTTTTCEALYMGVPVVTLTGPAHVSRVGTSLLTAAGLPHLAAPNPDEFINTAATLASDLPALQSLRRALRDRMKSSSLMDAPAYARAIESQYRAIWNS